MNFLLRVNNLTKKFNEFTAVDNLSFETLPGEIFGLLGPNGSGKTTTIRVIATVLSPTSGSAQVNGFDIVEQPEKVRNYIGVLTSDIGVYARLTGKENLEYFGRLSNLSEERLKKRIDELVDLLDMSSFVSKRAGTYSTGMKQRLAIARSVIHDPPLIFLDEPTSGLDVLAAQTVLNFMKKARDLGKCVIFSTHQMPDAERLCDRILIIHQGQAVAYYKTTELKEKTNTSNLEDAFLKLVKPSSVIQEPSLPAKSSILRNKISPRVLTALGFILIAVGLVLSLKIFNLPNFLGIGLIILGVIPLQLAKHLRKKFKDL